MPEKAQEGPSLVAQVWLARPPHHREMGGGLVGQGRTAGDSPAHMLLPAGLEKAARPDGPVLLLHQPAMGSEGQAPLGPKYVGLWDFEARTAEEFPGRGPLPCGQKGGGVVVGRAPGWGGPGPG